MISSYGKCADIPKYYTTGHSVDSRKTKVLATESNTFKHRIREAIEIKIRKPSLNRDNGFELARIYDTILAPSRPLYNPS